MDSRPSHEVSRAFADRRSASGQERSASGSARKSSNGIPALLNFAAKMRSSSGDGSSWPTRRWGIPDSAPARTRRRRSSESVRTVADCTAWFHTSSQASAPSVDRAATRFPDSRNPRAVVARSNKAETTERRSSSSDQASDSRRCSGSASRPRYGPSSGRVSATIGWPPTPLPHRCNRRIPGRPRRRPIRPSDTSRSRPPRRGPRSRGRRSRLTACRR